MLARGTRIELLVAAESDRYTPSTIGACTLPVIAHSNTANTAAALDAVDA